MTMQTSSAGRAAIMQREGVRNKAYRDSRGIFTIGVGHVTPPPNFTRWSTWTNAQVDAALSSDLRRFETAVNDSVKVPMTQNEFDACVSLAYNIGSDGFAGSSVVHHLNNGDRVGAAKAFLMWEKPAALAGRRQGERAQFLKP